MKNKLSYTFKDDLASRLKKPAFKKAWEESEAEYLLAKQIIEKRLSMSVSQRDLASKINSTQAVISRIETMRANPSIGLIKRIAKALNTSFNMRIA